MEHETLEHLIRFILKTQEYFMADLTRLNASVAKLSTDVDALIAAQTPQSAVDAAQAAVDTVDAKVVSATPAPPTPPTP